jgi:hypothetical protein
VRRTTPDLRALGWGALAGAVLSVGLASGFLYISLRGDDPHGTAVGLGLLAAVVAIVAAALGVAAGGVIRHEPERAI